MDPEHQVTPFERGKGLPLDPLLFDERSRRDLDEFTQLNNIVDDVPGGSLRKQYDISRQSTEQ